MKPKDIILLVKSKELKYLYKFNKIKCQEDKNKCINNTNGIESYVLKLGKILSIFLVWEKQYCYKIKVIYILGTL